MKTFYLPYNLGKERIKIDIPEDVRCHYIEPAEMDGGSIDEVIKEVLMHPFFLYFAKNTEGKEVALIVDDHTRPTPISTILPPLLSALKKAQIKIIYARGTHDMPSSEILCEKIGKSILNEYPLIIHDAYKEEEHKFCGITKFGTPIWMNKEVVNAQVRIGIGSIFPSELSGFTGGYKILLPGVSFYETINRNHSLALSHTARFGKIKGNIFREDIDEAGSMVGLDFLLNFVIDVKRKRYKAFFPHPIKAHREGALLCSKIYRVKRRAFDLVIASPGGVEDIEFVQTMKALYVANLLCKEGGTILLLAACPMGLGWMEFYQLISQIKSLKMKKDEILKEILRGRCETLAGFFAYSFYELFFEKKKRILIYSHGLKQKYLNAFGIEKIKDIEKSLEEIFSSSPKECCILPYAASMLVS